MYKLVIQDDEGKTTVVPLIRDELTIGRKEGNTIRLTERNVSRRHARLVRSNGSITIEDLNSYNGIRVNGSRIQGRCQIRESDRVQIGDYLIEIKSEAHDKVDTLNERTIPIERIDPHAHTPVPEAVPTAADSSAVPTTRMDKSAAPSPFAPAVTEPLPAGMPEADPGTGQTLATPAIGIGASAAARLVVLSTNFAGREFELDKAAMIIGRTEENDICINHRSISRHHAKIVRENGRYAVVDLQSSNGVRVNGEEYGKVELRRADVVDLGHVRLRFVEPGEDFVFGRDAQVVDVSQPGSPRLAMWIALGLLVTGATVALFLILSSRGSDKGDEGESAEGTNPTAAGNPTEATNPAATAADAAPTAEAMAPVSDEMAKQLDLLRQAIDNEKWADAQAAARKALVIDANNKEAQAKFEQAKAEMASEKIYKLFARAVAAKNFADVADLYNKLGPDSVYRIKAQPDHDRLKADFIRARAASGKKLADRGKCKEQRALAHESGKAWPEAEQAVLAHPCKDSAVAGGGSGSSGGSSAASSGGTSSGGTTTSGGTTASGGTSSGGATPPAGGESFEELLEESRKAAFDGHYGKALRSCEAALEKKPKDQEAIKTCAVASCKLKSAARAKKYIRLLNSETRQQMVRQMCLQSGVTDI
jgi:pSer/pThr/pTyr-binding forkhead associated (FHA) protein